MDHRYRREIDSVMGLRLRRRVTFTGKLDHAQIRAELARTHLWVSASLMEVQSLAVLEALASGTPVMGLANETIDELVDSEVGGRLDRSATPRQFAEAARALCENDPASYDGMRRAARRKAQSFDWARAMELTERMYRGALRRKGPVRRGTLAILLLLAVAQMLISMLIFRVLQLIAFFARPQIKRRTRTVTMRAEAYATPLGARHLKPLDSGQQPRFSATVCAVIGAVPKR